MYKLTYKDNSYPEDRQPTITSKVKEYKPREHNRFLDYELISVETDNLSKQNETDNT